MIPMHHAVLRLPAPGRGLRSRMGGVTLIEVMVVIALVGILLGIGVPSYKSITTSYRISGEINGLLGDVQFARAEALKEGQPVTICALPANAAPTSSGPPTQCATAGTSVPWQNGWIIYPVVSGAPTAAESAQAVLRYQPAFSGTTPDTLTGGIGSVTFNRDGLATGMPSSDTFLSLHDPANSSRYTRCLQITVVGAAQVTQPTNNSGCT